MAQKQSADAGQAEAQSTYDEAAKKGYFGQVPNQPDNKAYSMQSGPESPTAFDEHVAINEQKVVDQKASPGENS